MKQRRPSAAKKKRKGGKQKGQTAHPSSKEPPPHVCKQGYSLSSFLVCPTPSKRPRCVRRPLTPASWWGGGWWPPWDTVGAHLSAWVGLPRAPGCLLLSCTGRMEAKLGTGASSLDKSVGDARGNQERTSGSRTVRARAGRWETGGTFEDRENIWEEAVCAPGRGRGAARPHLCSPGV